MFYIGVRPRDKTEIENDGYLYESNKIENYIKNEHTFRYYNYENEYDLYILEREKIIKAIEDIEIMIINQIEIELERKKPSLTMLELDELRKYLKEIRNDRYFSWESFTIGAVIEAGEYIEIELKTS